jgi:YqaJ-like recombinase protein
MSKLVSAARASRAPDICHLVDLELFHMWEVDTGRAAPEDLSRVFPVQWGKHGEPFVLDWVAEREAWDIVERQRNVKHPQHDITATIDGYIAALDAVIECKVLNPLARSEDFIRYYGPQVAVQMACRPAAQGLLCVQQGNGEPNIYEVPVDAVYIDQVIERVLWYDNCVKTDTPPSPPPPAPVPPERWRTVDLNATSKENWVLPMKPHLDTWRETRVMALTHEQAKKDVKLLLPADVGRVVYGPITVKRSRNGAVSISGAA